MAEVAMPNGHGSLEEKLARISKKAGVRAALILDRGTGVLLKAVGDVTSLQPAAAAAGSAPPLPPPPPAPAPAPAPALDDTAATPIAATEQAPDTASPLRPTAAPAPGAADQFSAMVWRFVQLSATMVADMDTEDELRLLRLRTKKQEIVIVPDPRYLLIVVHDTPPA